MTTHSIYVKGLFLVLCLEFISVLSCTCPDRSYKIIGPGDIEIGFEGLLINPADTIRGEFSINMFAQFEYAAIRAFEGMVFTNSAYGLSCERDVLNPILDNSISISIDKPMLYRDEEKGAGENLLSLDEVYLLTDPPHFVILFSEEFVTDAVIEKGAYLFSLNYSTTDGLNLSNDFTLYLDL